MTSLLRRLSLSLESRSPGNGSSLASHPSFNDFSFHTAAEVENSEDSHIAVPGSQPRAVSLGEARAAPSRGSPFAVGSAPAGLAPILAPRTAALKIPRPSVAHALAMGSPSAGGMAAIDAATPRSGVVETPRRSEDLPASPRSPASPSARRRPPRTPRSPKYAGMDAYDYCELLRSTSL